MKKLKIVNHNFFMQKDIFRFELLTNVISGPKSIYNINNFLVEKNYKKIGLVIDKNLSKNSKYIKTFLKQFQTKNKSSRTLYFNGSNEPTYQYLDKVIKEIRKKKNKFDCLIAIGGGSTIDFAKGIATLIKNPGSSLKYKGFPKNLNPSVPIVAVPSTTGAGAELAYNAVFIDKINKTKLGINSKTNYPILSILDPIITVNSPKKVILNSSVGALVRSIDTMFNKKANEISTIFSENSFKLLFNSLPKVLRKKNDIKNWSKMQWGAYFSVAALLNSYSGPGGSISYYLSTNYGVPQGLGYSISSIYFFERNHNKGFHEYSKLYDFVQDKKKINKSSVREKSKFIIKSLIKILKKNKLSLKKYMISKEENAKILKFMLQSEYKRNSANPIKLGKEDLKIIIKKILST